MAELSHFHTETSDDLPDNGQAINGILHPANGGAPKFRRQVAKLAGS